MPQKITAPLSILVFLYLMIIGFSVVVLGLSGVAAYDINYYLTNKEKIVAHKNCQQYLDKKNYLGYEKCCQLMIKSFK